MKHSFLVFVLALSSTMITQAGDQMQTSKKLNRSLEIELDYLLSLPENYESKNEWPLILFLHGAGERGDNLDRVKIHGPPKLIASGEKLPFIVVSPQCPKDRWWNAVELTALLDEIVEKHNVDESRIYVTGLSMGG
ncbi:phospholipase, partial [Planctomicrobium sp.]|nr:phospholipase [Planctomicrobium sp.]